MSACVNCIPPNCDPQYFPYESTFYEDSHDGASLFLCPVCKTPVIHYRVEIFDDMWNYWVLTTPGMANELKTLAAAGKITQAHIIPYFKSQQNVRCKHPVQGYIQGNGDVFLYSGPPW